MIKSSLDQIIRTIDWYIKKKIPFIYQNQNETITVRSKYGSYTTRTFDYSTDELNFFKSVKRSIIDNGVYNLYSHLYQTEASIDRIRYYRYASMLKPSFSIKGCLNIDLTNAYWETANMYNLLPPHIYKQGLAERKQVRLTAIGSLAKKIRQYEFTGRKQIKLPTIRSPYTEMLWPLICVHVGKAISRVSKEFKNDFVFYWVDGIYVKPKNEIKIQRMFEDMGYKSKIHLCEKIEITPRHIWVTCTEKPKIKIVDEKEVQIDTWPFPYRSKISQDQMKGYIVDL